jgi:hypothetical protein
MNLIDATKSYADQMEAIGIVKEWMKKSDKPNERLNRLAYLLQQMILRINNLEYHLDDLKFINEHIIDKKNKEILKLRGERWTQEKN